MNKISQTATSFVPCEKIITCEHIFTMSSFPYIKVIPLPNWNPITNLSYIELDNILFLPAGQKKPGKGSPLELL